MLALIGAFYFVQMQRLSSAQDELAAQEARNAALTTQIAELQPFATLQAELAAKQALVDSLFLNEISWSGVLLDVSRVIPDTSYLTNLTGQITAGAVPGEIPVAPVGGAPETTLIGSMSFQGVALQTDTIATWLTRLEQVNGWVNAWVNSAQEEAAFSDIYSFSSGLDLTLEAATKRGQGGGQE